MKVPVRGNNPMFQLNHSSHRIFLLLFLFYSQLPLIELASPTIRREICPTQSTDSNVNLIPNTLTGTCGVMFDQIAHLVQLTHEINCQNMFSFLLCKTLRVKLLDSIMRVCRYFLKTTSFPECLYMQHFNQQCMTVPFAQILSGTWYFQNMSFQPFFLSVQWHLFDGVLLGYN